MRSLIYILGVVGIFLLVAWEGQAQDSREQFQDPFATEEESGDDEDEDDGGTESEEDAEDERNERIRIIDPEEEIEEDRTSKEDLDEEEPEQQESMPDFRFPEGRETQGPITQDLFRRERVQRASQPGTWNLQFKTGVAFNLNRRFSQLHLEVEGGHRFWENIDLNAVLYMRSVDDHLLGLLAMAHWNYNLTPKSTRRIDLGLGGGPGWVLRGPSFGDFEEGRLSMRGDARLTWYATKTFALISSIQIEAFFYAVTTDRQGINLMRGGGPPTQWIPNVGLRFEF